MDHVLNKSQTLADSPFEQDSPSRELALSVNPLSQGSLSSLDKPVVSPSKVNLVKTLMQLYNEVKDVPPIFEDREPPQSPKQRIFKHYQKVIYVLMEQPETSVLGVLIFVLIIIAILINVIGAILSSAHTLTLPPRFLMITNLYVLIVFGIELILRCFSATAFNKKLTQEIFKLSYLIDILAIAPLIANIFFSQHHMPGSSIIQLGKACSILKFLRYSHGGSILKQGLKQSITSLAFLMLMMIISNFIFATLIYYAEQLDPKSLLNKGIPTAFWWSLVTMATVGYGDIVPITVPGRVIGSFVSIYGMLMIALPVVILGYHFQEVYNQMEEEKEIEALKNKELKGLNNLNRDHKESVFLKKRIDDIGICNKEITGLLQHSGNICKEVSVDLKLLYKSIYRGTKDDLDAIAHPIHRKIKVIEEKGRFNEKVSLTRVFKRGFRKLHTKFVRNKITAHIEACRKAVNAAKEEVQIAPSARSLLPSNETNRGDFKSFRRYIIEGSQESKESPQPFEEIINMIAIDEEESENIELEGIDHVNKIATFMPRSSSVNKNTNETAQQYKTVEPVQQIVFSSGGNVESPTNLVKSSQDTSLQEDRFKLLSDRKNGYNISVNSEMSPFNNSGPELLFSAKKIKSGECNQTDALDPKSNLQSAEKPKIISGSPNITGRTSYEKDIDKDNGSTLSYTHQLQIARKSQKNLKITSSVRANIKISQNLENL